MMWGEKASVRVSYSDNGTRILECGTETGTIMARIDGDVGG
jgi:hypothetical protein